MVRFRSYSYAAGAGAMLSLQRNDIGHMCKGAAFAVMQARQFLNIAQKHPVAKSCRPATPLVQQALLRYTAPQLPLIRPQDPQAALCTLLQVGYAGLCGKENRDG